MGGTSVAAPIDPAGALYWNPAAMSGLEKSEIGFGAEILIPRTMLTSRVAANTFGTGIPAQSLSGVTGGNNGVFALPSFGLVYKPEESPISYGFGLFVLGGFGTNYPVSKSNPILNAQYPNGLGVGPLYSNYQALQLAPTISYQLTDDLSIGIQPNLDIAYLALSPGLFTSPSIVQGPLGPGPIYPDATHARSRIGGGFQVGAYYAPTESDWSHGVSFKSPQWFETATFPGVDTKGDPVRSKFNLDLPMIASFGTAYRGIDKLLLAADFRYIGYRQTNGYRHTGFDKSGALRGLGFQDIFAMSMGAQYQLTENLTARAGYTFNMNPIGNAVTMYNIASPLNLQHSLALGMSYNVTKALKLTAAYEHFFQNTNHGPIIEPGIGQLRNSDVRAATTADSVVVGVNVSF